MGRPKKATTRCGLKIDTALLEEIKRQIGFEDKHKSQGYLQRFFEAAARQYLDKLQRERN